MWVYIVMTLFLIYVIVKERQSLGCPTCPNGQDCDNQRGKATIGTRPDETDTTQEIYDKINKAATFTDRHVLWRIGYIIGFLATFIIIFILYQTIPTELELLVTTLIVWVLIYFTLNFYNFHLIKHIEKNIRDSAAILQSRGCGKNA